MYIIFSSQWNTVNRVKHEQVKDHFICLYRNGFLTNNDTNALKCKRMLEWQSNPKMTAEQFYKYFTEYYHIDGVINFTIFRLLHILLFLQSSPMSSPLLPKKKKKEFELYYGPHRNGIAKPNNGLKYYQILFVITKAEMQMKTFVGKWSRVRIASMENFN